MTSRSARSVLRDLWRAKRVLLRGAALALVYHRIAVPGRDPNRLAVSPERFDEHVRMLSRDFDLVPAAELLSLLERRKRIPRRTVCITLDDGYADALSAAHPVLREHGAPATVFVCSGYLDADQEFWWDELEYLCLSPHELPARIEISGDGIGFRSDLGVDADYRSQDAQRDAHWVVSEPPPSNRQRLYVELSEFIKRLTPEARRAALDSLRRQTGIGPRRRPTHRPMDSREVTALVDDGLVEVGGHTADHQMLSACSVEEQRRQIEDDKGAIERLIGRDLRSFSYPHGGWDDFGDDAVRTVEHAGYVGAFTTRWDAAVPWTDRFRVPRYEPRDMPAAELSSMLGARFDGRG